MFVWGYKNFLKLIIVIVRKDICDGVVVRFGVGSGSGLHPGGHQGRSEKTCRSRRSSGVHIDRLDLLCPSWQSQVSSLIVIIMEKHPPLIVDGDTLFGVTAFSSCLLLLH